MFEHEFTGLPSVRQHTIPTTQTVKKPHRGYFPDRWQDRLFPGRFPPLALRTEKGTSLSLDNPLNDSPTASLAGFVQAIVDLVLILIASLSIDGVAISTVAQRGALLFDRLV